MDRHFLIAVSDQKSALFGVRFVAGFFSDKHDIKSTLFHSAPKPPAVFEHEKSLEADRRQKEQQRKIIAKGKKAVENAKLECVEMGFLKENLRETVQEQIFSKVADIINEGEKGSYDAVVLGRRGLSMLEEVFEDSVSRTLFNERFTFPLWLCCSADPARKNVLLYVDGTPASFQMADHVGFIVGLENRHKVDIFALNSLTDQASLMDQYKNILINHGVTEKQINIQIMPAGNPASHILKLVEQHAYAAVAMGKSTKESSMLARLFKGPVCSILFKELKDASLWLCP